MNSWVMKNRVFTTVPNNGAFIEPDPDVDRVEMTLEEKYQMALGALAAIASDDFTDAERRHKAKSVYEQLTS